MKDQAVQESKWIQAMLVVFGLIGVGIGAALLFIPVAFQAKAGIVLGSDASLLSEVRAPGGALLASGILIMAGAFVQRLTFPALIVATLVYLSYGVSRVWSMAVDGMPTESLVVATVIELVCGVLGAFVLFRRTHGG